MLEAVEGVTAEQARWKPVSDKNSLWQIVEHVTASKAWQIEILEKGSAAVPPWIDPEGGESAMGCQSEC
ncbi:MAG: DinB family protein [Chloroflexota bacterium]